MSCYCAACSHPPCSWCEDPNNNPDKPHNTVWSPTVGWYCCMYCDDLVWNPRTDEWNFCGCNEDGTDIEVVEGITKDQVERALDFIRNLR